MDGRIPCEFFLVRYVPDVVKGEFTNIGVVLREAAAGGRTLVRFTRDWSRVRCMDAEADVALLEALEGDLAERLQTESEQVVARPILPLLQDTLANSVQMTEARATLAESLPTEMEQLLRLYVESLKVRTDRRRTGRAALVSAMRSEMERAGVWRLMRKRIAAALYTQPGDPMKIDCGYRPNGVIRMFHAVSLESDVESAKGLAYSAGALREGVRRVEGATLELTAIVEPLRAVAGAEDEEATERYRFGITTMEQEAIRVMTTTDLPRIAQTARTELRV